mmetsp:Transcript_2656/g.3984  ORF Transcript_2656/g.3984 Transcript_2656/m.3984 type:complete len:261 (-) Transcript_2656:292-1074(-)
MSQKRIHPDGELPPLSSPNKLDALRCSPDINQSISPRSPQSFTDSNRQCRISSMQLLTTVIRPIVHVAQSGTAGDTTTTESDTRTVYYKGRYRKLKGGDSKGCKSVQAKSLRDDLIMTSKAHGVLYNTTFTDDDYEAFRESFQLLMKRDNDFGVHIKVLLKSLIRLQVYTCKKEAYKLLRSIPGKTHGMISYENIIAASKDIHLHQRNKLRKFMKVLPETCKEKGLTWLFGDGFPTPKDSSSRFSTGEFNTKEFNDWAAK